MGAEAKTIKVSAVLDIDSFNRVTKAFRDLTNEMQKFAKAAQSAGGFMSGANVGKPPTGQGTQGRMAGNPQGGGASIGKIVADNANAFKNLAGIGTTSLRGLTDALKSNVRDQVREVHNLRVSLEALEGQYAAIGKAGLSKFGPAATSKQQQILGIASQLNTAQGNLTTSQNALNTFTNGGGAGPGTKQSFSQQIRPMLANVLGPGMANNIIGPTGALGAAGVAAAVVAGIKLGAGVTQGINNFELDMAGNRGATLKGAYDNTRSANISDRLAVTQWLKQDPSRVDRFMRGNDGVGRIVGRGASAAIGAVKGAFTGDFTALDTTSAQFKEMEAQAVQAKNTMEYQKSAGRALDYLDNSRGSRRAANRVMGRGISMNPDGTMRNNYSEWSARLTEQGFDQSEAIGAFAQTRNAGGRQFAKDWAWRVMSSQAGGYGGLSEAAMAASRSEGNAQGAVQGALGRGIGTSAGYSLSNLLYGYDNNNGPISGRGVLGMAQHGMGEGGMFSMNNSPTDFNSVARIAAGMRAGDRQFGGGADGWAQGQNLLSAMKLMPGGSSFAQDQLANGFSLKELAAIKSGEETPLSMAYKISPDMAGKQWGNSIAGQLAKYPMQGSNDFVERAVKRWKKAEAEGMNLTDYADGLGTVEKRNLAIAFQKGAGGSMEEAYGLFGLTNNGKSIDEGKIPGAGKQDTESAAKNKALAEQERADAKALTTDILKTIETLYGQNGSQQKALEALGGAAGKFAESVVQFGKYVEVLTGHKLISDAPKSNAAKAEPKGANPTGRLTQGMPK